MTPAALIVAAGRGTRTGGSRPKQYEPLGGKALLAHTAGALLGHGGLDPVRVVIHRDDRPLYEEAVAGLPQLGEPVIGGDTRQQSVLRGLEALDADAPEAVVIHDAARPFVDRDVISRVINALEHHDGAVAAIPVADTIVREGAGLVVGTVDRQCLWAAQTPQGFRFAPILAAHRKASADGALQFTDDASVARWAGLDVAITPGDPLNRKITTGEDLDAARRMFGAADPRVPRVGHGYDVHAFEPGDHVMLCGVKISHSAALKGHSDADVGLHALTDAIFGALCEGDIGQHFPPTDEQWKGAGSEVFLRHAGARVTARGGSVAHVDVTLVCEAPKIAGHARAMRQRIGEILALAPDRVSVKATTSEGLGFTGRREGIAAYATATIMLPM